MFCAKVVLYCNNRKFIAMALSSNPLYLNEHVLFIEFLQLINNN